MNGWSRDVTILKIKLKNKIIKEIRLSSYEIFKCNILILLYFSYLQNQRYLRHL
jgi:hypothetical protein